MELQQKFKDAIDNGYIIREDRGGYVWKEFDIEKAASAVYKIHLEDKHKYKLLIELSLVVKLMNKYDGTKVYNTPMKLYKDVFNSERHRLMNELNKEGIEYYTCEHGKSFALYQICNCNELNKQQLETQLK